MKVFGGFWVEWTLMAGLFALLLVIARYMLGRVYELVLEIDAPVPMIKIIADIDPRPVMLVGGGKPMPFTGSEGQHLQSYLRYAGDNAELWVIPEAIHCDGPAVRPEEYAERLVEFFDSAFQIERR